MPNVTAEILSSNVAPKNVNITRKRGRPPKSKVSEVFQPNETPSSTYTLLEKITSPILKVAESLKTNLTPDSANIPRKRGRPRKLNASESFETNKYQEVANTSLEKSKPPKSIITKSLRANESPETADTTVKRGGPQKSKNTKIFQTNGVLESANTHLKKGRLQESNMPQKYRKAKSKIASSPSINCYTGQCSTNHVACTTDETSQKQLKFFPIFNISISNKNNRNDDSNKESERHDTESCKIDGLLINNLADTNPGQKSSKVRPKKRKGIVKELDAILPEIENPELYDCSLTNEISSVLHNSVIDNRLCESQNTELDIEVSEILKSLCLKTEQTINDCQTLVLNDVVTADEKLSLPTQKTKKKLKKKKISEESICIESNIDTFCDETIEGTTARRKSLRSRGIRNDVNYSEIDLTFVIPKEQQESQLAASMNHCPDIEENDPVVSASEKNNKHKKKNSNLLLKTSKKNKNVKENIKLFPIFTSNKATAISPNSNVNQASKKRKASCDGVPNLNNGGVSDDACEKNCRSKRVKSESTDDTENDCEIVSLVLVESDSMQDACNSKLLVNNKTNILNQKRSCEEPKSSETFCNKGNKTNDKENIDVNDIHSKNVSQVISYKKPNIENICFPTISHVNVIEELLPEVQNKNNVDYDSDYDIITPVWDKVHGIVDSDCNKMIKSKGSYLDSERILAENAIPIATNKNSNDNMLWTDLVQNSVAKENKNETTIKEIKSWLLEWKDKFSKTSRIKKYDSDSSSSSSDSDSDDDSVTNSIIINGAPGTGKTNLVFRLANELGFTVIEVNASSSRSGRNISSQLKEALESYHMESIKVDNPFEIIEQEARKNGRVKIHKESKNGIESFLESNNKDNVKSSKKKQSIANFFQPKVSNEKEVKTKHIGKSKKSNDKNREKELAVEKTKNVEILNSDKNPGRISSLTIILFDDVDIVFEEDEGFWGTVKGFLKISKKPVIFTVGRNLSIVKAMLNCDIQIFNMIPTSKESSLKMLKAHCENHSRANTNTDLQLLTLHNLSDLRRNILNAQFWTQNPTSCIDLISNASDTQYKSVHVNSFIAGDLKFSNDQAQKLLFNQVPNAFLNAVSQYQSLGYDVLYSNLFYLLDVLDSLDHKNVWKSLLLENSSCAKNFTDSQMWEEACEIFKQKKKALKNGAASRELIIFADTVDNFSFADMLKGLSSKRFQWIPVSERIKLWTDGLPMCCDDNDLWPYDEAILQSISLINIFALRQSQKMDCFKSDSNRNNDLILEHTLESFDQVHACATDDLNCLSAALPLTQQLNKSALNLDYLSIIKIICREEESRQLNSGKRSGRFLHYFDSISFLLEKRTF